MTKALPEPGRIAFVRQHRWLIEKVSASPMPGEATLVGFSCLDDDAQDAPLSVLWEYELDVRLLEDARLRQDELQDALDGLRAQLERSRRHIGIAPKQFRRTLSMSLRLAGAPALAETEPVGEREAGVPRRFAFPAAAGARPRFSGGQRRKIDIGRTSGWFGARFPYIGICGDYRCEIDRTRTMPLNAALRTELLELVPYGLLATRPWLMERGIARHAVDNLVKSGQLIPLRAGVYVRPGSRLVWQGIVYSLQRMGGGLVVGGTTALELHGRAHYLPLTRRRAIHLHGPRPLPPWINGLGGAETFHRHGTAWLPEPDGPAGDEARRLTPSLTVDVPWGGGFRAVRTSTAERALFEILKDVPAGVSFEYAERLMEGLADLSPRRLDALLRRTRSVKVKRLFFWLAERQGHAWAKRLEPGDFDLGRGKRVLAKGGRLVSRYGITVPEAMHG